ncbi:uncharacterized protein LOC116809470 [Hylobates moloch]|uniref:uncharacterized protein LOC116809470 n=1 Tax=Hylobates moloch TaxID=81572 RepID=UPI00267633AC|nr:uncharacterized protein LOC116809470 [Hylobates moloch]
MFYKVFHKASAAPQATTSLNMDGRHEITVFTKLVFSSQNLSFQSLQAYFMHAQLQKQEEARTRAMKSPNQSKTVRKKTSTTISGILQRSKSTVPVATLLALIFFTICDKVSRKYRLAVLIISCAFKFQSPRLHSSLFSAPFIFLFPLIIEVSIPSFRKCGPLLSRFMSRSMRCAFRNAAAELPAETSRWKAPRALPYSAGTRLPDSAQGAKIAAPLPSPGLPTNPSLKENFTRPK